MRSVYLLKMGKHLYSTLGGFIMKKNLLFTLLLSFSLVLAACGNNNESNNEEDTLETPIVEPEEETVEQDEPIEEEVTDVPEEGEVTDNANASNDDDMARMMDKIDYQEFELEVEYPNDGEYEIEIEHRKDDTVKAKIEDEVNNIEKYDEAAFNDLYPLVSQLTITQQTTKEEAIQETLAIFNLSEDYEKFELEIKFKDGTKIEFESKK